jgi:hypothetical protein
MPAMVWKTMGVHNKRRLFRKGCLVEFIVGK